MIEVTLGQLAGETGGQLAMGLMPPLSGDATPVGKIVTDSRRVEPGHVFWALRGPHHNGSDFAAEAFARGAMGVVVEGRPVAPWAGRWSLHVDDARRALGQVAAAVRRRFQGKVIAVTGSVGKTTTRQMIHTVLACRYTGTASPANYNNDIGVPLTMLNWNALDDYAVVELGASAAGEVRSLARLCQPHLGVITCLGEAHLGGFGTQAQLAEAKGELLAVLESDGIAMIGDDPQLKRLAEASGCPFVRAGRHGDCDLVATGVEFRQGELRLVVDRQPFRVPVWGRHHLGAAMLAIAVGRQMDIPLAEIAAALESFQAPPQRCQVVEAGGVKIIDDTYNASPRAMRAALELLRDMEAPGRRILVCGDMLELGPSAPLWHRQLGEQVVTVCGADLVIACGEHARNVVTAARDAGMPVGQAVACQHPRDAVAAVRERLAPGDVVLVKGSRALVMERLVEALQSALAPSLPTQINEYHGALS